MSLKIGSLFAGYGGLDLGIQAVVPDVTTAWVSEIEPGACKVLAERFPGAPNIGDITAINHADLEPVDIICGGSPCFPAGTLIDTRDGYRPIETIQLGDEVLTHRRRYMPVAQLMSRDASDTLAVKVMGAPEFVTTQEHPFYTRLKGRAWNNDRRSYDRIWNAPEWVPAGDLTPDHFVGFQIDARDESVPALGTDLAHLVGRWLGDGWTRTAKRTSPIIGRRGSRVNSRWHQVYICCAHQEADELAEVIRRAGFKPRVSEVARTVTKFRIDSRALVALLSEFGSGAAGKRVPGWVYRLPQADQAALWDGWRDSDGHVAANGAQKVTTVSEELAHGMARVARNAFHRAVSVHHSPMSATCVIEGRTVNQRDQYQVVLPPSNREAFLEDGWCWVPVRTVRPTTPARVYNFGVKDDESYTAWGITVHNCQDLSSAGARAGMTEGTRSNLWVAMRETIAAIQPNYVVWENVKGAYSAVATSRMESDPGLLGDHPATQPPLRVLGRVLGDLASLGYDTQWHGIRASDIGAPHARYRVFALATKHGAPPLPISGIPAIASNPGPLLSTLNAGVFSDASVLPYLVRMQKLAEQDPDARFGMSAGHQLTMEHERVGGLGMYTPAAQHWERQLGRPAPEALTVRGYYHATITPRFCEWMMGLPEGWITDVDGVSDRQAKAMCGNGVVPQQAAAALQTMALWRQVAA